MNEIIERRQRERKNKKRHRYYYRYSTGDTINTNYNVKDEKRTGEIGYFSLHLLLYILLEAICKENITGNEGGDVGGGWTGGLFNPRE